MCTTIVKRHSWLPLSLMFHVVFILAAQPNGLASIDGDRAISVSVSSKDDRTGGSFDRLESAQHKGLRLVVPTHWYSHRSGAAGEAHHKRCFGPRDAALAQYIKAGYLPGMSDTTDYREEVQVRIDVEKDGSVRSPEDSSNCADSMDSCQTYRELKTITLTATGAEDWFFRRWISVVPLSPMPEIKNLPDDIPWVSAEFVHRPGLEGPGLINDFGVYLLEIGATSLWEDVFNCSFDRGHIIYKNGRRIYAGDSIPDIAQIGMLDDVLCSTTLDLSGHGGLDHNFVWDVFQYNQNQAQQTLPSSISSETKTIVAAYMTLGTYPFRNMIISELKRVWDVTLDPSLYSNVCAGYFASNGDADNDGFTNAEEWSFAAKSTRETGLKCVYYFTTGALDPDISTLYPPEMAEGDVSSPEGEGDVSEGEGEGEGEGCRCVNDSSQSLVSLTFINDSTFPISASALTSQGRCSAEQISMGVPSLCQLGRKIKVQANDLHSTRPFRAWCAPNTLIDGSGNRADAFMHTRVETVMPLSLGNAIVRYENSSAYRITWDVESKYKGAVTSSIDSSTSLTTLVGPEGALVTLKAAPTAPSVEPGGWGTFNSGAVCEAYSLSTSVAVRLGEREDLTFKPLLACSSCPKYVVTVSAEGGGMATIGALSANGHAPFSGMQIVSTPSGTVTLHHFANPGWMFEKWTDSNGHTVFPTTYDCVNGPCDFTAVFAKLPSLRLETAIIQSAEGNQQYSAPECAGYVMAAEAKKYYGRTMEYVCLTALPRDGYSFVRWLGEGKCYADAQGASPRDLNAADADSTSHVTSPSIYIQFQPATSNNLLTSQNREITALFKASGRRQ